MAASRLWKVVRPQPSISRASGKDAQHARDTTQVEESALGDRDIGAWRALERRISEFAPGSASKPARRRDVIGTSMGFPCIGEPQTQVLDHHEIALDSFKYSIG